VVHAAEGDRDVLPVIQKSENGVIGCAHQQELRSEIANTSQVRDSGHCTITTASLRNDSYLNTFFRGQCVRGKLST
jgi:hypothetical protein